MDNLIKAMHCCLYDCDGSCSGCVYDQTEYTSCESYELIPLAITKIVELQKSNRNWRRKAQRLRKKIKELEEKENV